MNVLTIDEVLDAAYGLFDGLDSEHLAKRALLDLARDLVTARELVSFCRDVAGRLEQAVAAAMTDKKMEIPSFGVLERRVSVDRKDFDHPLLAAKVATAAVVDRDTGEVLTVDTAVVNRVLDAFMKACRPEWRVGGLKELGIDIDDYCSKEFGVPRVQVTVPK